MIRFEPKKEPPKHVENERERADREAPELERMGPKVESKAAYMRKWRARREEAGG
jgi:hypothetical protein